MRRPLVHFLALGALLFAIERGLFARGPVVEIGARRLAAVEREHAERTGRAPDAAERRALLEREIDDELLVREALARGIDRDDPVVRERLVRNMRFLRGEDSGDADALLREARALGMDRSDTVVRRRLIQQLRFALEGAADASEPDDAELLAFLERHPERFATPDRVRLSQRPFAPSSGEASLAPLDLPLQSRRELEKLFGPEFARAAFAAPLASWSGPIASSHGRHRVYIHERVPGGAPPLEAVRARARGALLEQRRAQALRRGLAALRGRYRVRLPARAESTAMAAGG